MNKKISNDQNIKNLKKRKVLRIIVIIFSIITIILSILSIFYGFLLIYAVIAFLIAHFLLKYRESIVINKKDDLKYVRKELSKKR